MPSAFLAVDHPIGCRDSAGPKCDNGGMSNNVKRILVATSLGESGDHVVRAGRTIARFTGSELHLLHAYTISAVFYGSPMGMAVHPYPVENEQEQVMALLDDQLERLGIAASEIAGRIVKAGAPHRLAASASQKIDADLVVVGASESHGALEPLVGSTADRVLRQSHAPVLVVRGELDLPPATVLAPIDLSDLCEESVRTGLAIVSDLSGDTRPELKTIFVLSELERSGSSQFTSEQIERFANEELERRSAELHEASGWTAKPHLRTGTPRHEILAELEEHPADLVVLGTHGRSGFERLLLGSVAGDIVRQAKASVLVVPPDAARHAAEKEALLEKA